MTALALSAHAASALLMGAPLRPQCARAPQSLFRMSDGPTSYEEYARARDSGRVKGGSIDSAQEGYKEFVKYDKDFDGGDSGGGVVGDGNTDLEDQHNSASVVRGGFGAAVAGEGGVNVGRGAVKSATEARTASAGKNYFGRSTGYAEKKISEISEADKKNQKMDCVRAQQLENWHNQRGIAKENRAMGQGVVFGEEKDPRASGGFSARRALESQAWREGSAEGNELDQRALNKHLDNMRTTAAERLDGEEWSEISADDEEIEATYEVTAPANGLAMTDIKVKNMYNTFAPYQCDFTPDSPREFTVSPNAGSMNRRSGDPIEVTVRYQPKAFGPPLEATLVFETEDFKKVYKFIGST